MTALSCPGAHELRHAVAPRPAAPSLVLLSPTVDGAHLVEALTSQLVWCVCAMFECFFRKPAVVHLHERGLDRIIVTPTLPLAGVHCYRHDQ